MTYQNSFRFGVHLRHFCLFYIVEVMPHLFGFPLINMIFQTKGQLQETEKESVCIFSIIKETSEPYDKRSNTVTTIVSFVRMNRT